MAKTKVVQERDALARRLRACEEALAVKESLCCSLRDNCNARTLELNSAQDEGRRLLAAAMTRVIAVEKERDAMRTERDRALGQLKCAEATSAELQKQNHAMWYETKAEQARGDGLRAAIVKLACLLPEK